MSKLASTALLITFITLLSKLIGFIRDVVMAGSYGTTIQSDAYFMAQSIIGVITGLFLSALGTTFIPVMTDYLAHKTKNETNKFLNVVFTVTTSLTIILCILGLIFTKELVNIFAPDFSKEASSLTVELTRIMLPTIVLTVMVTIGSSKLQNHGSYLVPNAIGFPLNFVLIITMLFFTDNFGITGLAVSTVIGTALQILMQFPFTHKLGYRFKLDFDLREEGLRRIGVLIIPIMIGSGIQQINTLVNRILASGLTEGSIAALNFSNRLSLFITSLFSAAIVSVYYTSMSKYFTTGEELLFKKLLKNTINISGLLIIPASFGLIVLRLPIVQLIFERGAFDSAASIMTSIALLYYTIGLIGFLLRDVVSRAFYALKDTKTAMINGSIAVIMNIILSIVLVPYLGLGGLALGTSISGILGTILLMFSLYKKIGDYGLRNIMYTFIKIIAASAIMAVTVHYFYIEIIGMVDSIFVSVALSIVVGIIVYVIAILLLKIEELNVLRNIVSKKFRRIKNN
jgi:putative peptidoglycan lipid II flippase